MGHEREEHDPYYWFSRRGGPPSRTGAAPFSIPPRVYPQPPRDRFRTGMKIPPQPVPRQGIEYPFWDLRSRWGLNRRFVP